MQAPATSRSINPRSIRSLLTKSFIVTLATILLVQFTACGTILHPERKGQKGGQIDPAIAILDGIGLLLFFLPGVIAFAVDFSNGTIYLPGGRHSSLTEEELRRIAPNGKLDEAKLAEILRYKGMLNQHQDHNFQIQSLDSLAEWHARLAIYESTFVQAGFHPVYR